MKTLALTTIMVLCISVLGNNVEPKNTGNIYEDENLTKSLVKTMTNPEDINIEKDAVVIASFQMDENGTVQIKEVQSGSPLLADYVSKKLMLFRPEILEEGTLGRELTYRFLFRK